MIRYVFGINPDKTTNRTIYGGKLTVNARIYRGAPGESGAGSGVQSVTGGVVDNTDPLNPVLAYPTPADIGAYPNSNPSSFVNAAQAAAAAPIQTVSGTAVSGTAANPVINLQDLSGLQLKSQVVSTNIAAVLDGSYTVVATATITDPTPVEGKGFVTFVRNGTATVGGTAYSVAGTVIVRIFHSGAWANYVYFSGTSDNDLFPFESTPILITGTTNSTAVRIYPIPTDIGNCGLRITAMMRPIAFTSGSNVHRFAIGTIASPTAAELAAAINIGQGQLFGATTTHGSMQRTFSIVGGASGSIKYKTSDNQSFDFISVAGTYSELAVNWTVQHYIYEIIILGNAANVVESFGRCIEKI